MANKTKILLIGKNGQVGWELHRICGAVGNLFPLDYPDIDLRSATSIRQTIKSIKPNIILNAAAYTAVDKAEDEPDVAMEINGIAPAVLAKEANRIRACLIHYSTDYVFDGTKESPYNEDDVPNPLGVYGKTKLEGDRAVERSGAIFFIFRTSWVYGWRGHNFLLTMLRLAKEREEISVVDDQVGAPTWARNIAEATVQIILNGINRAPDFFNQFSGIYNMTAAGLTSWYGFAREIFASDPDKTGYILRRLSPISSDDYKVKAKRPKRSILDNSKLQKTFNIALPEWNEPLRLWKNDQMKGRENVE